MEVELQTQTEEEVLIEKTREFLKGVYIAPKQIFKVRNALLKNYNVNIIDFVVDYEIDKFTFMLLTNLSNKTHCISIDIFSSEPKTVL